MNILDRIRKLWKKPEAPSVKKESLRFELAKAFSDEKEVGEALLAIVHNLCLMRHQDTGEDLGELMKDLITTVVDWTLPREK